MVFILCYLKEDTLKVHFCIILRDCKSSIKAELGNEHLMTGPTRNSEFCFPETLNIEVEGKQNSLTPERPVNKWFIQLNLKIEKILRKIILLDSWHTNLPRF